MNRLNFHTLSLKNVEFDGKLKNLVKFLGTFKDSRIEKLILDNCNQG